MECRVPCRERDEARFNLNKRKNKNETKGENEEEEKKRYKRIHGERGNGVSSRERRRKEDYKSLPHFISKYTFIENNLVLASVHCSLCSYFSDFFLSIFFHTHLSSHFSHSSLQSSFRLYIVAPDCGPGIYIRIFPLYYVCSHARRIGLGPCLIVRRS